MRIAVTHRAVRIAAVPSRHFVNGRTVVRGIATNWASLAINIVISFFLSPYVVNKLGSTYYGIWAVTLQLTGYLYLLDFGVRESVIRYTSRCLARNEPRMLNAVLGTALSIYLPVTLGCLALAAVCAFAAPTWFDIDPAHHDEARLAILLVGGTVAQAFVFNVFTGVLIGLQRFELTNAVGIVLTLVRTALIVVLLARGYGIVALAAVQFGVGLATGLVYMLLAGRLLRKAGVPLRRVRLPWRRRLSLMRRIGGYGWYVLVNNIGQKIIFASSALIVGIFMPIASVTYYAIASSLVDYQRMLLQSTSQVFNPLSSKLQALGRSEELAPLLLRGAKGTVLVAAPISIVYMTMGSEFIRLWMGPEFAGPARDVLFVLALTQMLSAPHHIISGVLYGMSRHRIIALLRFGEGIANVLLSVVLVQYLGLIGVALGAALTHIVVVVFILPYRACRVIGLDVHRYLSGTYVRALAAGVPMALAAAWLARNYPVNDLISFFAQVAALVCLYAASAYVIALDHTERAFLKKMIRSWAPA